MPDQELRQPEKFWKAPKQPRTVSLQSRRARTAWLFLSPALLLLLVVAGYPLYRTISLSFYEKSILEPDLEPFWVALDNYHFLIRDSDWWISVWNTVVFTVVAVAFETIFGLFIALLVNHEFRGRGLMRTAMLVPWALPTVVAAQMWAWMFHDNFGVVNDLIARTGLLDYLVSFGMIRDGPIAWLASSSLALPSVIAVDVWKTTPFMALLLLAGLQSIPRELYEAASVDGAGVLQRFWRITLPNLKPALLVALIFRTLDSLRVFDVIYVMTGTKPDTWSMSVYARQQLFEFGDLGYGSAVSTGIFLVIAMFTAAYVVALRVEVD